jgi:hypothetical protein
MDEKLMKLMAQLGLLAVIVWVLAGAFGHREDVTIKQKPRRKRAKGDVWNHFPLAAPSASFYWEPPVVAVRT